MSVIDVSRKILKSCKDQYEDETSLWKKEFIPYRMEMEDGPVYSNTLYVLV